MTMTRPRRPRHRAPTVPPRRRADTSPARAADAVLGVHRRPRRHLPVPAGVDGGRRRSRRRPAPSQVDGWGFGNYATLADYQAGIWRYLVNSAFVSLLTVALTLLVSLLGGYAFARFRFPGKNLLFLLTLAILMVPYATLLIPLYVLLNRSACRTRWSASRWC